MKQDGRALVDCPRKWSRGDPWMVLERQQRESVLKLQEQSVHSRRCGVSCSTTAVIGCLGRFSLYMYGIRCYESFPTQHTSSRLHVSQVNKRDVWKRTTHTEIRILQ
jgi:hypothetical protein